MQISVAMTTYNGAKYIKEQLESLRQQTRKIDEVYISDDGSSDQTPKIVTEYIEKWDLQNWHFYINEQHNGWIYNFHQCIEKITGDIVFFSDQDDIWDIHKIERMSQLFSKYKEIDVLCCNILLINDNDQEIREKFDLPYISKKTGKIKRSKLDNKFTYNIRPGCTMAVKRSLIDRLENYPGKTDIPHDAYYWKTAVLLDKAFYVDEPLVNYRIHPGNASNPTASTVHYVKNKKERCEEAQNFFKQLKNFESILTYLRVNKASKTKEIERLESFERERIRFINKEISTIAFYLEDIRYYQSLKMFIGDYLCRVKGN